MMEKKLHFEDWGLADYAEALEKQHRLFLSMIETKQSGVGTPCNRWVFCEHPPVITLGTHGKATNLLYSADYLSSIGVSFYHTDRGGDITFHGPGQVVAYPLLDLEAMEWGLKQYIHFLEEVVIRTLSHWNLKGERLAGATGVWLDVGSRRARKICAIGVKSSRYVTMHGFALNVNTDLLYFSYINPCGFVDKGVTSMARELGESIEIETVKLKIREIVENLLQESSSTTL